MQMAVTPFEALSTYWYLNIMFRIWKWTKYIFFSRRLKMAARILILCCLISLSSAAHKLQEIFSWNVLDWEYPDLFSKQQDINSGALQPENALPVGIEKWGNKLFVSVPRWKAGMFENVFFYFDMILFPSWDDPVFFTLNIKYTSS